MSTTKRLASWEAILLVGVGGMSGATLRYLLGAISGEAFAMTVIVNIAGCYFLGVILFATTTSNLLSLRIQAIFASGFFASFTTYSTFIADIFFLSPGIAIVYIIATYIGGIGAIIVSRRSVNFFVENQVFPGGQP